MEIVMWSNTDYIAWFNWIFLRRISLVIKLPSVLFYVHELIESYSISFSFLHISTILKSGI